jgi:hypothetical protein
MNTITILVETYGKDPTATIERWHRTANQHSHKRWPPSIPKSGIIIKPISFVGQQQHPKKKNFFEKDKWGQQPYGTRTMWNSGFQAPSCEGG